ncbi:DNA-processing protein DprA [Pelagicoccus sp. SDUM812005]|uniref:DNA-processing protein DprA n=1 Tax=Pelagicoccus sp. SDUM812005 TaxID=3041257 RepID=UPI00280E3DFA|nr:DNA-processing protein DprA [Pelagicoccus sp. SDUM812005]MDQ8183084.1 DNA-processing protein DprA [Pelagicoccus sp. SDUM812005]
MELQLSRKQAFWALNGLPAIGPVSLNRLLAAFAGDPCRALNASRPELESIKGLQRKAVDVLLDWSRHFNLGREMAQAEQRGVDFVSCEDEDYPPLLKEISDPPIGLYRLGEYDFSKPSIAIVGTRHCTLYGQSVARSFARELAQLGFCVTSGMARGIDTFAHKGALEVEGGSTVCVFGCGIDIVYPPENVDLFREAQRNGAVVSEFPFGRRADRQTFPMRNRVVSGMSHAVIVVESDDAGGSMITARFAGEQGRVVCAIPGRIDQKSSKGSHQLIRDGAVLLRSVDDLLEELAHLQLVPDLETGESSLEAELRLPPLQGDEGRVAKLLAGGEALALEDVGERIGKDVSEVSVLLMTMELNGLIAKRLDGRFEWAFS